ncbi:PP2C family protein-serine/threonine phosphatase [Streptomyces avicenniae]|uniref:PP2C family protein-serine/threonine phosphatase n=1 Tax=Streptomyces avicenniae TaxID=500153 RepID=UPI000AACF438|nr:PP2C family protein-serine/threonine phosphatase [Streptomyces avicenniae]
MTSPAAPADPAHGTGDGPPWDAVPCPLLLVGAEGTVLRANGGALALLPAVVPGRPLRATAPDWLISAHRHLTGRPRGVTPGDGDIVCGPVGGRTVRATPTPGPDGGVTWWLADDSDDRHLADALRHERDRTAFLTELSNRLLASLNLDRCMEATAWLAATHMADGVTVIASTTDRTHHVTHCVRGGEPERRALSLDLDALPELGLALSGHPPSARGIDPAALPARLLPPGMGPVGSVRLTPLPGHGRSAGVMLLLGGPDRDVHGEQERERDDVTLRLFAARAGAAMSAARLYAEQAAITATLTRDLLPPHAPRLEGVELATGYRPSGDTERIGGDFYDVHPGSADVPEPLVVLGDVSGKGLDAAVLTGKIRTTLHALIPVAPDHRRLLDLLNGALLDTTGDRFATLVLASVGHDGPALRLRLTSAGHPPPLVLRTDGTVETVATSGTLLGVLPHAEARTAAVRLAPGDACLLHTDGITEARGGPTADEFFGEERLRAVLAECAGLPAEAVAERVQMVVAQWLGSGRHDDIALAVLRAPAAPRPGRAAPP